MFTCESKAAIESTLLDACDLSRACEGHGNGRVGACRAHCSTGLHRRHRSALKEYRARDCGEQFASAWPYQVSTLATCGRLTHWFGLHPIPRNDLCALTVPSMSAGCAPGDGWYISTATACCCSWLRRLACRLMLQLSCSQPAALWPLLPQLLRRLLKQQVMAMR